MYKFIGMISILVRQYCLPNPFEGLQQLPTMPFFGVQIELPAEFINFVVGLIMAPLTYAVVGIFYMRGSAPVIGSLLYLIFYCAHTGLLYLICSVWPNTLIVALIIIGYILAIIGLAILRNKVMESRFIK